MKRMLRLIAVGVMVLGQSTFAQDTSRHALAEELLNSMNMQESLNKSFDMMKKNMARMQNRTAQSMGDTNLSGAAAAQTDSMMDRMAKELTWDNLKEDYITIYAETFTEEELKGLIAFYTSPIGKAFQEKQPALMARTMDVSQKAAMKVMEEDPAFKKAREALVQAKAKRPLRACLNNLRMLDAAKEQAAMAHRYKDGDAVKDDEVGEYVKGGKVSGLVCPDGGHYILNAVGKEPECSTHGTLTAAREKLESTSTNEVQAAPVSGE